MYIHFSHLHNLKFSQLDVSVPCLLLLTCGQCKFTDLKCVPGCRNVAVFTTKGLEAIVPLVVPKIESRTADYIVSRFWLGTTDNESSHLFCGNLLLYWYHLQHMIQGISQRKFLETLRDLFEKHNWCSTISPMDFEMAS
ncbi:Uncharacterized protein APZ42_002002, partial [Daphnia magna]